MPAVSSMGGPHASSHNSGGVEKAALPEELRALDTLQFERKKERFHFNAGKKIRPRSHRQRHHHHHHHHHHHQQQQQQRASSARAAHRSGASHVSPAVSPSNAMRATAGSNLFPGISSPTSSSASSSSLPSSSLSAAASAAAAPSLSTSSSSSSAASSSLSSSWPSSASLSSPSNVSSSRAALGESVAPEATSFMAAIRQGPVKERRPPSTFAKVSTRAPSSSRSRSRTGSPSPPTRRSVSESPQAQSFRPASSQAALVRRVQSAATLGSQLAMRRRRRKKPGIDGRSLAERMKAADIEPSRADLEKMRLVNEQELSRPLYSSQSLASTTSTTTASDFPSNGGNAADAESYVNNNDVVTLQQHSRSLTASLAKEIVSRARDVRETSVKLTRTSMHQWIERHATKSRKPEASAASKNASVFSEKQSFADACAHHLFTTLRSLGDPNGAETISLRDLRDTLNIMRTPPRLVEKVFRKINELTTPQRDGGENGNSSAGSNGGTSTDGSSSSLIRFDVLQQAFRYANLLPKVCKYTDIPSPEFTVRPVAAFFELHRYERQQMRARRLQEHREAAAAQEKREAAAAEPSNGDSAPPSALSHDAVSASGAAWSSAPSTSTPGDDSAGKPRSETLPFDLFMLALQRKLRLYQVKPRSGRGRM